MQQVELLQRPITINLRQTLNINIRTFVISVSFKYPLVNSYHEGIGICNKNKQIRGILSLNSFWGVANILSAMRGILLLCLYDQSYSLHKILVNGQTTPPGHGTSFSNPLIPVQGPSSIIYVKKMVQRCGVWQIWHHRTRIKFQWNQTCYILRWLPSYSIICCLLSGFQKPAIHLFGVLSQNLVLDISMSY